MTPPLFLGMLFSLPSVAQGVEGWEDEPGIRGSCFLCQAKEGLWAVPPLLWERLPPGASQDPLRPAALPEEVLAKLFLLSNEGWFSPGEHAFCRGFLHRQAVLPVPGVEFSLMSGEPGIAWGSCPAWGGTFCGRPAPGSCSQERDLRLQLGNGSGSRPL